MDLALTADQEALTAAFAAFFSKEATPEVARAAEPLGFDGDLWARLVEMGVPSMATPEAAGGGGASLLDVALVTELVGRHIAPVPIVEATVAARLLARTDNNEWLTKADDGAVVTVAVGGRIVPGGAIADAVVILDGDRLLLVPTGGGGAPLPNLGALPLGESPAATSGAVELAHGDDAVALHRVAVDEWKVLAASMLTGITHAALEIAVEYTKARHQFGRPIASFQSIAHRLADDATAAEGARLLARKAAWAADNDAGDGGIHDAPQLATMAYLYAGEVANHVTQESLHFHGGYGFMLEYDIQLLFRRAKAWAVALGDPSRAYARLGREITA